jgi:hypothetical protein
MRDTENFGGGDELPRVPQRDRGREGDHIADEDQERDSGRFPVRWALGERRTFSQQVG